MKIQKTILAMTGILLLVVVALFLPGVLNDVADRNGVSKLKISEDESRYEISKTSQKTTDDKLKTLEEVFEKKKEAQVLEVSFKANMKKVQEVENKISEEYAKWVSMAKNLIAFKGLELDNEGELYYENIALYTIYNTNISYYVCDVIVASNTTGNKCRVRLYVDSDNFKIYLLEIMSVSTSDWVKSFWGRSGSAQEWVNVAEERMKQYLTEYYEIDNITKVKRTDASGIVGMHLNDNVIWNIGEWTKNMEMNVSEGYDAYAVDFFGVQIGIREFEQFTYSDSWFDDNYIVVDKQ